MRENNSVYIVTGAAGHLGSYVVKELLARGEEVRALVLPKEHVPPFVVVNRHNLREYEGNVCKPETLLPLFNNFEGKDLYVIHCAGIVAITKKADKKIRAVNVFGTSNIIAACKENHVKRLLYVSSVHAIPGLPRGEITKEITHFDPDNVMGYYDKTKAEATQLVLDAAKEGLDALVVHPSGIIGPNGLPTGNMAQLITLYLNKKLPVAIKGGFDFVDVRDVARGIVQACRKGRKGECYILSNRYVELEELFTLLAEISGRKKIRVYIPLWVAKAFAPLAELHYKATHQTPVFTGYSIYTVSQGTAFSHQKATEEFGYQTRPLKESLTDIAAWIKESRRSPEAAKDKKRVASKKAKKIRTKV